MVATSPCFFDDGPYRGGFERDALEALLASQQRDMHQWSAMVADLVMKQPKFADLSLEVAHSFSPADPKVASTMATSTILGDYRDETKDVRKPTLILQSAHDDLADVAVGRS